MSFSFNKYVLSLVGKTDYEQVNESVDILHRMINVREKVNQNKGIKSDNGSQGSPLGHGKN